MTLAGENLHMKPIFVCTLNTQQNPGKLFCILCCTHSVLDTLYLKQQGSLISS